MAEPGWAGYKREYMRLSSALLLTLLSGCQCNLNNINLGEIKDAGFLPHDAGPTPPKFPLKVGDEVVFPALGGRTADCPGSSTPGDCQRSINADYTVRSTALDEGNNRWTITADAVYQGTDDFITAASIDPLVMANVAPFSAVTTGTPSSAPGSAFTTDTPATDELTANGFPFFQYASGDAQVFETSGQAFCDRYTTLDAQANCRFQNASQQMTVYYKDSAGGGGAKLHKVQAEYHNMGLICGWDEEMIPFIDGTTARNQSDFNVVQTPDVAAIFFQPHVIRDGTTYQCDCFSQQCSANGNCLNVDPDIDPGPCP